MACLPARLDLTTLDRLASEQTQPALAERFGCASWSALYDEVERRTVLNARDVATARERIAADPSWATADLTGWCDHRRGAAPLNYMAMLRFDAHRLGLTGELGGTGEMAALLLESGAPVDGNPGDRETPLMTAASYGDAGVARVLIDAGAQLDTLAAPDAGGVPGGSALLHAAVFGMTDVLDEIVRAGAQVRGIVEAAAAGDLRGWPIAGATNDERIRALIMAADHQRLDVIDALLDAGTPIDAVDPTWGRHALRLAAQRARVASVRHLLARGADPALTDHHGRTALDLCDDAEVAALLTAAADPSG